MGLLDHLPARALVSPKRSGGSPYPRKENYAYVRPPPGLWSTGEVALSDLSELSGGVPLQKQTGGEGQPPV